MRHQRTRSADVVVDVDVSVDGAVQVNDNVNDKVDVNVLACVDAAASLARFLLNPTVRNNVRCAGRKPAMCLGVPGKVLEVVGLSATVDFFGVRKVVRLDVCNEPVKPGDYVLNHVGFAIHRIPDSEIAATLALFDQILADAGPQDLMAADVRGEIQGGGNDARR